MRCYHMTTVDRLESINELGLMPRKENNSKLINDTRTKVFFSQGYEGVISLFIDFNIVYNKIKKGEMPLSDSATLKKIMCSKNLREYLGDGVYLCFESEGVENENVNNSVDCYTSKIIEPHLLKILLLKNEDTGEYSWSRNDILHYMMSKVNPENIMYNGIKWPNTEKFKNYHLLTEQEKIYVNQIKIKNYYFENSDLIERFRAGKYSLIDINLADFLNLKDEVCLNYRRYK